MKFGLEGGSAGDGDVDLDVGSEQLYNLDDIFVVTDHCDMLRGALLDSDVERPTRQTAKY